MKTWREHSAMYLADAADGGELEVRRSIGLRLAAAFAGGLALFAFGCGSDDPGAAPGPDAAAGPGGGGGTGPGSPPRTPATQRTRTSIRTP